MLASGAAAGPRLPLGAKFQEQPLGWAKAGKSALQQIEADKGGKRQEPFGNEDRAALDPEGKGEQDETAGHDADDAFEKKKKNSLRKAV